MPIKKVPGTDKVIFLPDHIGDTVIDLGNYPDLDNSLKFEDVPVVGNWEDYSGSGTKGPQTVAMAGAANALSDSLHAIEAGADLDNLTVRGNRADTTRKRIKLVTIDE